MIIKKLNIEQYHAHDAVTNSKLKVFHDRGPYIFQQMFIAGTLEKERTKALDEGAGFDCCVFDGDAEFAGKYVCKPSVYPGDKEDKPWNMNANYCKAWAAAREAEGKTVLDSDAFTRFVFMREAMKKNPAIAAIMAQSEAQLTFRMQAQRFGGLEIQARPDLFSARPIDLPEYDLTSHGLPFFSDLKTTEDLDDWYNHLDLTNEKNGTPVWKFGYHRQAAMVQWIGHKDIGPTDHFLIVQEKRVPYRNLIVRVASELRELGYDEIMADLENYNACRVANKWPGPPQKVLTIRGPNYLYDQAARASAVAAGVA